MGKLYLLSGMRLKVLIFLKEGPMALMNVRGITNPAEHRRNVILRLRNALQRIQLNLVDKVKSF